MLESARELATWPVRMWLPLSDGQRVVDTGGGVDRLARGDPNVRIVSRPERLLGPKGFWHVDPIERVLGTLKGKRILDIGCGVGYIGLIAALRGARVVATEMNESNILRAELVFNAFGVNDNVMLVRNDMQTANVDDLGVFDAILLCGTIYHCEFPWEVLGRISQMTDCLIVDSRIVADSEVNDRAEGFEFYLERYSDSNAFGSIRRVGGGAIRKPTRRSLWRMLKASGFDLILQTMPYPGLQSQFQEENFIQYVALKNREDSSGPI